MNPSPRTPKPRRPMPFANLPALSQRDAIYVWGTSAMIFGVLAALLIGLPLVVFVLWPIFVRWGFPSLFSGGVLIVLFILGAFFGSWTGRLAVHDLGKV